MCGYELTIASIDVQRTCQRIELVENDCAVADEFGGGGCRPWLAVDRRPPQLRVGENDFSPEWRPCHNSRHDSFAHRDKLREGEAELAVFQVDAVVNGVAF